MKQLKLSWLWLFSALMISGGVFVGCQKDLSGTGQPDKESTSKVLLGAGGKGGSIAPVCSEVISCNSLTKTLFAGQIINVGSATAGGGFTIKKNNDGTMTLNFKLSEGIEYGLDEVHVYIGDGIGLSEPGGDAPGQFPFSLKDLGGAKEATITLTEEQVAALSSISNDGVGNICYVVAAHAAISGTAGKETAWACGERITESGNWSMKFQFCTVPSCEEEPPTENPCSLSQGYWFANTTLRGIDWAGPVVFSNNLGASVSYPQNELQPLFPAKTNVVLKAVFQASALQLNIRHTALSKSMTQDFITTYSPQTWTAYQNISNYLVEKNLSSAMSLSTHKPNANDAKRLQTWASAISNFIKGTHCGTVYDPSTLLVE